VRRARRARSGLLSTTSWGSCVNSPASTTTRLVGSDDRPRRLGDVALREESPKVGLAPASAAQPLTPAAVVEEQHVPTVVKDGFMSRRYGDATSVSVVPDIGEGHETNDAGGHRGIFATGRWASVSACRELI
jgi:hypothetical protein